MFVEIMTIDVIDFTQLQKRGLLKQASSEKSSEVIDFSASSSSPSPQAEPSENAFDLLSSLAQASTSSYSPSPSGSTQNISLHFSTLTNKLDDVMYKLETLISRVMQLEARFDGERRN